MAEETDVHPEKVRKTVSFTHKQLGISGGIIAAIMMLDPLKSWFFTREEGVALDRNVIRIEQVVEENRKELLRTLTTANAENTKSIERKFDQILEFMRDQEDRTGRANERQDRRIENLEFIVLTKPKHKGE